MKKQLMIASALMLAVLCAGAQQTGTGNTQGNNKNTKKTNKNTGTSTNQSGTGNNQGNTGTTGDSTGTTGGNTGTTGTGEVSGQMTSVGRYAAMGVQMGSLHRKDMKFVMEANSSNSMELQLSQIALQKATSPAVKEFAQMMVQHHTMAGQEMKQLLSSKGTAIPDSVMLPAHRMRMEMLQNLQGADFDKAYMRIMVDAHEEDLDEYEDVLDDARDADIRTFANKMLPTLRTHYSHAKDTRKKV